MRSRWELPWGARLPGAAGGDQFVLVISHHPFLGIGYLPGSTPHAFHLLFHVVFTTILRPHFSDWQGR